MIDKEKLFYDISRDYKNKVIEEKCYYFKLAGKFIKIVFNSPKLVNKFTVSLEFLAIPFDEKINSDLTIFVWENQFTDKMPEIFSSYHSQMVWRGGNLYFKDNNIKFLYSHTPSYYQCFDEKHSIGYCCVNDEDSLPFLHVCHPFRLIFHWWAEKNDLILTHAAGIGMNDRGVLLVAAGGSGKSTTSITALLNGVNYIADDYVLLEPKNGIAHFIYSAGYLNMDIIQRLPMLNKNIIGCDVTRNNKTLINLMVYKDAFMKKMKYTALVFPVLHNKESNITLIQSKSKALTALAVSTTMQNEGWLNPVYMSKLLNAVKNMPVYQFNIVEDFSANAEVIKKFIL